MIPLPPISTLFPYTTLFRSFTTDLQMLLKAQRQLTESLKSDAVFCHLSGVRAGKRLSYGGSFKAWLDRKSTRLNSSHTVISYAVFCLKKKNKTNKTT